ncbi:MAG: hypothetical protein ISS82_04525, partial [Nanoarchaeota archaeon]|nr:hypothetical protein [Nanoarchaeota archaeon]
MKNKIRIIIGFILFVLLINVVSGLDIEITSEESFTDGEMVSVDYSITSNTDMEVTYDFHVFCGYENPTPTILRETISLEVNIPYTKHFDNFKVDKYISSAECKSYVEIIEPIRQRKEISFNIITNPIADIRITTCKDYDCNVPSRTFVKGETVYVKIEGYGRDDGSKVELVNVFGNKRDLLREKDVSINSKEVSFEAKEGVYRISVDGDGLSHKIIESKAVYQVIKEKPEIKYKFLEG